MNHPTHPIQPEELMAYLDGELAPEQAAAAAAHLEQCAECRALATELRGVSNQMLSWQVELSPERLTSAVLEAAREAEGKLGPKSDRAVSKQNAAATHSWWRALSMRQIAWGLSGGAAVLLVFTVSVPNLHRSRVGISQPVEKDVATYPPSTSEAGPQSEKLTRSAGNPIPSAPPSQDLRSVSREIKTVRGVPPDMGSPMIARTASLAVLCKQFEPARAGMEAILRVHRGYIAQLTVKTTEGAPRELDATLQVPADQLDAVLAELKALGRVEQESQAAEEVTKQFVDLTARLKNARETEQRLITVLRERTGKVGDVLEVEQEIARVRGEIEQMDAERKSLESRVRLSTVQFRLTEEYKAGLNLPRPSAATRLQNAIVEGLRDAFENVVSLAILALNAGPTLLLWVLILFWPARLAWRRVRGLVTR